jgi:hypothetical protein
VRVGEAVQNDGGIQLAFLRASRPLTRLQPDHIIAA